MPASLSERNLYMIYAVLADYRQARDQHDTRAIADIAAGLDAWLRSLLEIVKSHKVTWVRCEERMPDTHRDVWVDPSPFSEEEAAPIASWCIDEWWVDDRSLGELGDPNITHWGEIRWPEPPPKEEGASRWDSGDG